MAVYLPLVATLIVGGTLMATVSSIAIALGTVGIILILALRFGGRLSSWLDAESDESLLLSVFGLALLVAGVAQSLQVSGAIGAFLIGLALSGRTEERAMHLISPLRDLFAATFFVFFSFSIDPSELVGVALPALGLMVVGAATKMVTGWYAAGRIGVGRRGRIRAGSVLIARGEFSIVIATLGAGLAQAAELNALAAAYVLATAVVGPVVTKLSDRPAGVPAPAIV